MAKLNGEKAQEAKAASTGFDPVPEGVYHAVLKDVDATRSGPKGPYWSWEFEIIGTADGTGSTTVMVPDDESETGEKEVKVSGRKQWNNTSLAAMWSFKQTYEAFGTDDLETDTDEFCGKVVKLVIGHRTYTPKDSTESRLTDQVNAVKPADPEDPIVKAFYKQASDAKEMADLF